MCMIVYRNRAERKPQEGGTILEILTGKKQEGVGVSGSHITFITLQELTV